MTNSNQQTKLVCENCGKPLFGRSDKRFCNDGCRNHFNQQKRLLQKQQENENIPVIFKIIANNYRILKAIGEPLDNNSSIDLETKSLIDEGFNFNFFTSIRVEGDNIYRFCFERGWYVYEGRCQIIDRPEQAELN